MSLLLVTMATAFTEPSVQTVFATKKKKNVGAHS